MQGQVTQKIRFLTGAGLIFLAVNNYNFSSISTQNIFFGLALFFILYEKLFIKKNHILIAIALLSLLILRILFINNSANEEESSILKLLLQHIKYIVFIIFFSGFTNAKDVEGIIRWLFYSIVIASVFGLLTHFIGEPFATYRMQFLSHADISEITYFSKGDRVVGLDTQIFSFAYPVVVGPTIALVLYLVNRKLIYLSLFFICLLAVLLNAERSSLGAVIIVSLFIAYKFINLKKHIFIIGFFILGIIIFNWFVQKNISRDTVSGFDRFKTQHEEGNDEGRIGKQLVAIIVTFKTPLRGGDYSEYERLFNNWFGFIPTYPHNAYINIGFQLGITAWLMVYVCFLSVYRSIKSTKFKIRESATFKYYHFGIIMCLLALFIVALFHNKGPFNGDFISICLVGLVLAPLNPKFVIANN